MSLKRLVIKKKIEDEIIEIPEERLCKVKLRDHYVLNVNGENEYIAERGSGEFVGKAIFLSHNYDWTLGKDSLGEVCLVPLKKEGEEEDGI